MDREHYLFTEKYRPHDMSTYIGNESLKSKINKFIQSGDVPHLLLTGPAGTGKTTAAKIISKAIESDVLYINASDENSVEAVRTKVKNFASTAGFSKLKIVILDEADFLSSSAQAALRNLMETFSLHTRFILTCNYSERIIEPLISRTQQFEITPPSKVEVAKHIANILKIENIEYTVSDLKTLIDAYFPDIRKIINECQLNSTNGKLTLDAEEIIQSDYKLKIINVLSGDGMKKEKFQEIRQIFADSRIKDFAPMYSLLYSEVDKYGKANISGCILAIADGQYRDAHAPDKEITACATIINILQAIQ